MFFENLNSSAIDKLEVSDDIVTIIFKSSSKEYKYKVMNEEFTNTLQDCIIKENSIGKLVNNSIKDKSIVELNTTTIW